MRRILLVSFLLLAALLTHGKERFFYIYSPGPGSETISMGDLDTIVRVARQYRSPYLWAQLDGRRYLIRNCALLAEAHQAMAPLRALEPEREALRRKMKPVERRYERIEDEIDDLTDRDEDGDELTASERDRLRHLQAEIRALRPELRAYEREEERLDKKQDALDEPVDSAMKAIVEKAIRNGLAERVR